MSKQTTNKAPAKRKLAEGIFNAALPTRVKLGNKIFRRTVREALFTQLNVTDAATVSLYNHAKKAAVTAGLVAEFGRTAPKTPVVEAVEAPVEVQVPKGAKWTVTATDGDVVFFASRAKARAEANGGKVAKLEA